MSKHPRRTCGTKSGGYCTDLDAYISKKQKVPANAKCCHKEIMSSRCLLLIYIGLHTMRLYFCIQLLMWLQPVITTFRVSDKSW